MKIASLAVLLAIVSCAGKPVKKEEVVLEPFISEPKIAFTVTEGISHPESAYYSAQHKTIFVSNVASGNPMETKRVGYLSKLSPEGKVVQAKWITRLKAPKGIAIIGEHLYVSDVNEIVKINIAKSKIEKTWKVAGAQFLNDVVADAAGNIYVSDMNTNIIHKISDGKLTEWIKTPALRGPNGLFTDGKEHVLMVQWGSEVDAKTWVAKQPGHITALSLTKPNEKINEDLGLTGHLDGIDADKNGKLYVSDWINGDIWSLLKNGKASRRYNFGPGTADISVAKDLNLLLIPQMNHSKLIAVEL